MRVPSRRRQPHGVRQQDLEESRDRSPPQRDQPLATVMMKDPARAALPPTTPSSVQQLLRRCLVKDPRQRIRDMGDVRLALESANAPAPAPAEPAVSGSQWKKRGIVIGSLGLNAALALVLEAKK